MTWDGHKIERELDKDPIPPTLMSRCPQVKLDKDPIPPIFMSS